MKKTGVFIIAFILYLNCLGQPFRFTKITSREGLSQSEVYSFLKDKYGFMWIGTLDGLNRYDGYSIIKFNINNNDSNSLSNGTIRALSEDGIGRIWIGTDNGLNVFFPETQQIIQVKSPFLSSSLSIQSLLADDDFLWIGTRKGLFKADIRIEDFAELEKNIQLVTDLHGTQIPELEIYKIFKSATGDLWIAMNNKVLCFKYQQKSKLYKSIPLPFFFNLNQVVYISEDLQNNIWTANYYSGSGLARFNTKTRQLTFFTNNPKASSISSNLISSLTTDNKGNLWIGTLDRGLNKINATDVSDEDIVFEKYQNKIFEPESLNSNLIYSLYSSNDNLLWIGTIGNGVNVLDLEQKKFIHYSIPPQKNENTLSANFIRSVYLDNGNKLWIGMHNNGLYTYNRQTGEFKKVGFDTKTIFYIGAFKTNEMLVCTSKGIYIVNDDERITKIKEINLPCFYFTTSAKNIYWIASINGFFRVEFSGNKINSIKNYNSSLNSSPQLQFNCRVIQYDEFKNEIWVGTESEGLNIVQLDQNHFPVQNTIYKHSDVTNSISNNYIRSIYRQNENTFWVGTYNGLNKFERQNGSNSLKITTYYQEDGLPNNMVQSIVEDNNHNLWIASNFGLSKFSTSSSKIVNYDFSDGLQSNEFSEHAVFKGTNGELFFGGINGVTSFFPEEIKESPVRSNITLTDFYLFNEKVEVQSQNNRKDLLESAIFMTNKLTLKPKENIIRFDFSAMDFASPQKVKYTYKLEGYDQKWNITDAGNRSAVYTNLPSGDFSFLVKVANDSGTLNENVKKLEIHIKTPFYKTWIAIIVYCLFIAVIIFYFTRYSIIKIATKNQILLDAEHSERLHQLDMIRTRFFINISHDLRTPLTLIVSPLEKILKEKHYPAEILKQLGLVYKNATKLKYLIEQLLDFRKAEVGKLNVKLSRVELNNFIKNEIDHFDYALKEKGLTRVYYLIQEETNIYIDTEKTGKIIFNLMSNAIKFTKQGGVEITVEKCIYGEPAKVFAKISIQDSGVGIEPHKLDSIFERFNNNNGSIAESSYGIGLSHCKDLIDAIEGHISVDSKPGEGSVLTFYIPFIEKIDNGQIQDNLSPIPSISFKEKLLITGLHDIESEALHKAKTILIAEDNDDMRGYVKSCFENDYNIIEAQNGEVGLKLAIQKLPDLIISDVSMPVMDGITFCEKIKTSFDTSHIPVILLTAHTEIEIKYKGLEKGADDYVSKPFDIDYLYIKVRNLIADRDNLKKLFQNNIVLEPSQIAITSTDEIFLRSLMQKIEKGIPDPEYTVKDLESEMAMSHSKFYNKVKNLTGLSGKEFLQEMRLKRAAQLIGSNTELSVAEISDMSGFSDPKYFSTCFKAKFKVSPTEFK